MDVVHPSLVSHRDRVHNGSPIPRTRSYPIWHIWGRPENVTYFPQWEHFSRYSENMFGGYLVTENLIYFRNRSVRMLRIFQGSREPRLSKPLMRVIIISYWIKYQYLSMKYTYPYLAKFDHIRTILFQVFISFESLAEVWLISLITNI